MGNTVAVHTNTGLAHQVRNARALVAGLRVHGLAAVITDADAQADIHVVQGPWYALERWRHHPNVLYIDRAYWGDPQCLSIHWLYRGEKWRTHHTARRYHPELQPTKHWGRSIYLCDYGQKPEGVYDSVRAHPADKPSHWSLAADLAEHGIAIGKRTTALVDAAIAGLTVFTEDVHSPVYEISGAPWLRGSWINAMAWHNWSLAEISTGVFLDAIGDGYPGEHIARHAH